MSSRATLRPPRKSLRSTSKERRSRAARLEAADKKYIWHPFTQMSDWEREDILIIESAEGVYLQDIYGRRYLDGVSSLWCNVHGHRVKEIDRAIAGQLGRVAHSTFLGLSNVPAIELAERLVAVAPAGLTRVFYSDSGSEAVEVAMKMAFQYWRQRGRPEKNKFVKLDHAYHGDTLGAVSVGGIGLFHEIYEPLLFKTFTAPSPYRYRWPGSPSPEEVCKESLAGLEQILARHHEEIAALVMEPLMQGAAGMIDQPPGYISGARELTRRYNALLIFDEVATGFGRTGRMFAAEHEQVSPDLMTVAKGLTGGYLPLAATLATEEIYKGFLGQYAELKTFFHGHTYTGNPLAAQAALASLKLFQRDRVLEKLGSKIDFFRKELRRFSDLPKVGDIRQAGFMVGIELVKDSRTKEPFGWEEKIGIRVIERARSKGAILRPLGSVIVLMPPLAMSEADLKTLLEITYQSIQETCETG